MEVWLRNILAFLVELAKVLIVTSGIMGYRLKLKWRSAFVLLMSLVFIIIVSKYNYFNTLSLIIGFLAIGASVFMLTGKYKTVCAILSYLSVSILDVTAAAVLMFTTGYDTSELYNSFGHHLSANLIGIALISLIALFRRLYKKPILLNLAYMKIAYILTSLASQIFFLLYLTPALALGFDEYSKPLITLSLSFSGVFFIISNTLVVEFAFSKYRFKSLYQDTRSQSENLANYLDIRLGKEREKQKIYHDMPYHLLSVQSFLNSDKTSEAKKYIDMLTEKLIRCGQSSNTGNHQLNAIISGCMVKYPNAKIEINGLMPDEINISRHDFCIILSNLLDNAFRMADMLSGAVKINIRLDENTLYFHVVNPVERRVKIIDNTIHSTKYGQGIGNIAVGEYLEKNGGKVFYRCSDKSFTTDLYLTI